MQVVDLDGMISNWQLIGNISHGMMTNKSSLHLRARQILHECFPTLQILEEVPIYVKRKEILYLDFYMPLIKVCVEVHGEQHYKFNRFFHNTPMGFIKQKKRDQDKQSWCELNNIRYVELPFDQTDSWSERIKNENQRTS
jgi:hypothetical protein